MYVVEERGGYSSVPGSQPYVQEGHPIWMSRPQLRKFTQSRVLEMGTTYPKLLPKAKATIDACPYLTNVGAYWETMQNWAVVARLWTIGVP